MIKINTKQNFTITEEERKIIFEISQWLQDNGFEEASKALDCYYNL